MNVATKHYRDDIVKVSLQFAVAWALLAMAVGVLLSAQLVWPQLNFDTAWATFGRIRPIHTNGVVFGFGVTALMSTAFYTVQRTCMVQLFAPRLAWFVIYGWQVVLVLGALSLAAGWTSSKEYAELEWPFDIAIAVIWVAFAIVFFGTIARRKIRAIYVSNWFYGGFIIVIGMLHIFNNLAIPVSLDKSYSLFPGAQDAILQWWYGHNAVGFLLTGGFLGMLYYFLPKQAERPLWSYRLSIIAFWSFTYAYIWAGPHHLHYNSIPEWVQGTAMVMSVILLAPSWATMINGIMTVSTAWEKLRTDVALKFTVLALAFYGLATFEGSMMAIRSVNVVSHFTDWTVGHVHSAALGWNAMVTYGVFYYMVPKLVGRPLYSNRLANIHFYLALGGTILYIIAMWAAGVSQGLLWLAVDDIGELRYAFLDISSSMAFYYFMRFVAGVIFLSGTALMAYNFYRTMVSRELVVAYPPKIDPAYQV